MVIGPKELTEKIMEDDRQKANELEKAIDETLEKDFDGTTPVYFNPPRFNLPGEQAMTALFDTYREAGWDIKRKDVTDGYYYTFTPAKTETKRYTTNNLGAQIAAIETGNCRPYGA